MVSDEFGPLQAASFNELVRELKRRCDGVVMAYALPGRTSNDDMVGFVARGDWITKSGLVDYLNRMFDLQSEVWMSRFNEGFPDQECGDG